MKQRTEKTVADFPVPALFPRSAGWANPISISRTTDRAATFLGRAQNALMHLFQDKDARKKVREIVFDAFNAYFTVEQLSAETSESAFLPASLTITSRTGTKRRENFTERLYT